MAIIICRWMERTSKKLRMQAWRLLLLGVRNSGAAFIKWGQWSATREDLFPQVRFICTFLSTYPEAIWTSGQVPASRSLTRLETL